MLPVNVLLVSPNHFQSNGPGNRKFNVERYSPQDFAANDDVREIIEGKDAIVVSFPDLSKGAFSALAKLQELGADAPVVCVASDAAQKRDIINSFPDLPGTVVVGDYNLSVYHRSRGALATAVSQARVKWKNGASESTLPIVHMEAHPKFKQARLINDGHSVQVVPARARLLNLLSGGDFCGNRYIFDNYITDPHVGRKIVDVQICFLNKNLREAELPEVESLWGIGRRWPARLEVSAPQ